MSKVCIRVLCKKNFSRSKKKFLFNMVVPSNRKFKYSSIYFKESLSSEGDT